MICYHISSLVVRLAAIKYCFVQPRGTRSNQEVINFMQTWHSCVIFLLFPFLRSLCSAVQTKKRWVNRWVWFQLSFCVNIGKNVLQTKIDCEGTATSDRSFWFMQVHKQFDLVCSVHNQYLETSITLKLARRVNPGDERTLEMVSGDGMKPTYYISPFYATYYYCHWYVLGSLKIQ